FGDALLRGRIDRVDRCGDGVIVRDYKTGRAKLKDVLEFENLQLDVYLIATAEHNPVGAVFDRLRTDDLVGFVRDDADVPVSKEVVRLSPEEFEQRAADARERIEGVIRSVRAGRLAVAPTNPLRCTRNGCDAFDLCRVQRATWLARRARKGKQK
ncbi:MAG: PD-(D/E)XK nuclease family protein, partial [Planctomycetota bacterium]